MADDRWPLADGRRKRHWWGWLKRSMNGVSRFEALHTCCCIYRGTPAVRLKLTYRTLNDFNKPLSRRATAVHLAEFDSSSRDTPLPLGQSNQYNL
jgi:hypothetical protein